MKLLWTLCLLFITPVLYAQVNRIELGMMISPSIANLHGDGLEPDLFGSYEACPAYAAGIQVQVNADKLISVHTGILFERKGMQFVDSRGKRTAITNNTFTNLDYLVVPLLARLSFGKKRILFVNGGPYAGFLASAKSGKFLETDQSSDFSKNRNRIDAGLSAGIGVALPASKWVAVSFEVRENYGIANILKTTSLYQGTNSVNFIIGIACRFGYPEEK